ncbi:MAG: hypothetical protein O7B98_04595 [Alphaproteobacteria bacterium]|nr:hypothetical protein [Alphaproteobacteria bacterium]
MTESQSHKRAKRKAAGRSGRTEVPLKGAQRLDAKTKSGKTATEVERSGTAAGLGKAAGRLKKSRSKQKVLQVPQKDMAKAAAAMRKAGVKGSVKNMTGSKRRSVQ